MKEKGPLSREKDRQEIKKEIFSKEKRKERK